MAQRGRPKKQITPGINKDVENLKPYIDAIVSNSFKYKSSIYIKYIECCNTESDINQLLPYIFDIVSSIPECRCVEFGVRIPTSTWAFLAAKPKRLVSYDIGRYPQVDEVEKLCFEEKQDFQFVLANVLEVEIEETDVLFTDTYHDYGQLKAELYKHANKVKHYIIGHDWETHKTRGEAWYPGVADFMHTGEGIERAVTEFLADNPNWDMHFETPINNGLFILKRNEP